VQTCSGILVSATKGSRGSREGCTHFYDFAGRFKAQEASVGGHAAGLGPIEHHIHRLAALGGLVPPLKKRGTPQASMMGKISGGAFQLASAGGKRALTMPLLMQSTSTLRVAVLASARPLARTACKQRASPR
jgi:hypothetical protein